MKVRILSMALLAILVVVITIFYQPVLALQTITVSTDNRWYHYGDRYTISGKVSPVVPNKSVSIQIEAPDNPNLATLSVIPGQDGSYSYPMHIGNKNIPIGTFTIIATYLGAKNQTTFSYEGTPCIQPSMTWYNAISYPASNPRIVDTFGNAINGTVKVGQQIQIITPLANGLNCVQPFAYIVQIQNQNDVTVWLSWITGTMIAGQSLNPTQSWIPAAPGAYTAQIFVWQSIDNPNSLAPTLSVPINVVPKSNSE